MSSAPNPPPPPNPSTKPQHNILISIPRTASNLLTHLLALHFQPSIIAHPRDGYFFFPALSARFKNSTFERPFSTWSSEETEILEDALGQSASTLRAWLADAEREGRGTYVKEHVNWTILPGVESAFLHPVSAAIKPAPKDPLKSQTLDVSSNPTAVPNTFWIRVRTTLLIRHPALTFPSILRTAIDNQGLETVLREESESVMQWECTFRWHVLLYRHLTSQSIRMAPLIIDASQLQDAAFVKRYADAVGLDSKLVRTQWAATSEGEQRKLHTVERRMKDTLLGSSGVVSSKLSSQAIDIAAEKNRWESEFGFEMAQRLERLVQGAMGEYQWLYEKRWEG